MKRKNKDFLSTGNDGADELLEKMCTEMAQGGNVEEIADKYVKCSTPELRDELIAGLKAIQWLNDSINNNSEQKSS